MRFYLDAKKEHGDGVYLYNDGGLKIKVGGEELYHANAWTMPTGIVFHTKNKSLFFMDGKFVINAPPLLTGEVTQERLKSSFAEYLAIIGGEIEAIFAPLEFSDLEPVETRELLDEIKKIQDGLGYEFSDKAFYFSENEMFQKNKIIFKYEDESSGFDNDPDNIPVAWVCKDGLLLNGEVPTPLEIERFNKKMDWLKNRGNGGMTGRYRG